jgi:hypothetical protein
MPMRALDSLWGAADGAGLAPLREHIVRLCLAADTIERGSGSASWAAISGNLHMAASLTDIGADTDLRGGSFMCGSAADYEDALSEITRKHLAGVIVFNLCWSAYEGAVGIASSHLEMRQPKGARGRELLRGVGPHCLPHLQTCLRSSSDFAVGGDPELAEFRSLLVSGEIAAAAAEFLRCFRNRVVHGALGQPEPEDWGRHTDYAVDADPVIVRFRHHIRLVLLLTQFLMAEAVDPAEMLPSWSGPLLPGETAFGGDELPADEVLRTLHCDVSALPLFD